MINGRVKKVDEMISSDALSTGNVENVCDAERSSSRFVFA